MKKSDLISGIFVDREAGEIEGVALTAEDVSRYVNHHYFAIPLDKLRLLQQIDADPLGKKWAKEHADYIFVDEEAFFEFLFVYFTPTTPGGWEKSYQDLRKMVGPHPIDSVDLQIVETELLTRSLAKGAWKIDEARKAWQERRARRSRPTTQPLNPLTF